MPRVHVTFDPRMTEDERKKLAAVLELLKIRALSYDNKSVWVNIDISSEMNTLSWAINQARIPAALQGKGFEDADRGQLQERPSSRCPRCGRSPVRIDESNGVVYCDNCGPILSGNFSTYPEDSAVPFTFIFTREATDEERMRLSRVLKLLNIEPVSVTRGEVQLMTPRRDRLTLLDIMTSANLPLELALG